MSEERKQRIAALELDHLKRLEQESRKENIRRRMMVAIGGMNNEDLRQFTFEVSEYASAKLYGNLKK